MSLVFSAIIPHSPLLIPTISKENFGKLKKTLESLNNLANDLYASKPDSLIIISPHGIVQENSFLINFAAKYAVQFKEFGDFETKLEFWPDPELVSAIKDRAQKENITLNLTNQPELDYGAAVPLYWLLKPLPNLVITPISITLKNPENNFNFGKTLQKEIHKSGKRIAVIASADLSHCVTKKGPADYCKDGKSFDRDLMLFLKKKSTDNIIHMDPLKVKNASECGLMPICVLMGILNGINYKPQLLSYEYPFGVGQLCHNFSFN